MVHCDEWCTLRSDEEEHWDVTSPLHHDSSIFYSVLNLSNKLPSFTAVDDENDLFSLYSKEPEDPTFQNVHIPSKYSTAEDD